MQIDHGVAPYRPSQTPVPVSRRASGVTRAVAAAAATIAVAVIAFVPPALSVTGPNAGDPIEWGGRSFSAPDELAAWLRDRGVAYETWAQRHSAAAARLDGRGPVEPSAVDDPATPSSSTPASSRVAAVLFALALSLLLLPIVPRSIFARAQAEAVWDRRLDLAAVGLAVAVGLAIVVIF